MTRRTWSIAAVLLSGAAIAVGTYLHLERAMRREPLLLDWVTGERLPRDRWLRLQESRRQPPVWVEPYDGEAIGV